MISRVLSPEEIAAWQNDRAFRKALRSELTALALDADGEGRYVVVEVWAGDDRYGWRVDTQDDTAEDFDADANEAGAREKEILDALSHRVGDGLR